MRAGRVIETRDIHIHLEHVPNSILFYQNPKVYPPYFTILVVYRGAKSKELVEGKISDFKIGGKILIHSK
jgi:hypothetical protein